MNADKQTEHQPTRMKRAAMQMAAFSSNRWVMFTQKFILVLIAVIIVVDLFLAFNDTEGDTISNVLRNWAYQRFFVLTWVWGVLAGHLFLTSAGPILSPSAAILVLLGLTFVLLLAGFFYTDLIGVPVQVVLLVVGAVAGYLLWPQSPVPSM